MEPKMDGMKIGSDYYEVEYPTVEENKGATIFISHLDSCLGWDNEEEEK